MYSCGLWAPRSSGSSTKIRLWQAPVRSVLLYAAEAHAWPPRDVETPRHIARSGVQVSRERTQDHRKRLGAHTVVSTLQVQRLLGPKKCLREEKYPEGDRTGAGEAMRAMVFGRLSFEKAQAPPSRFVRHFLEDFDDLRRFENKAEEGDRVVEDARVAASVLRIDLPRENLTHRTNNGGNGCWRYLRRLSACCCRLLRELTSGQCEGGGDVVGVLTLLVGGVAQAFHNDRVVELRVQLGVEEVEGKDREEQVEVEREKRVKEGAPWMVWRWL